LKITDIETPALIIDLDIMEKNLTVMKEWLLGKKTKLKAHFKTPKSTAVAWRELQYGASGVCCQTLNEAEVLVNAGVREILLTNQIVQESKIQKMINLLNFSEIKCLVDDIENIRLISRSSERKNKQMDVLIEVNVGMNRCGVEPSEALNLAKVISLLKGVRLKGIQAYDGHLQMAEHTIGKDKKMKEVKKVIDKIKVLREDFEHAGIYLEVVSGAGTGTYKYEFNVLDEVQAGSYALMDWRYKVAAPEFDMAATVLSRVISISSTGRVVVDCGTKACSTDSGMPLVKGSEHVECHVSSDEHGVLNLGATKNKFRIGDMVELYPSHICTTVNLHDKFYAIRNGEIEAIWPINARSRFT
jgi:D-serine deaminase-like pyridoxal phosphate-dependent protein